MTIREVYGGNMAPQQTRQGGHDVSDHQRKILECERLWVNNAVARMRASGSEEEAEGCASAADAP